MYVLENRYVFTGEYFLFDVKQSQWDSIKNYYNMYELRQYVKIKIKKFNQIY